MHRVYRDYERRKSSEQLTDFEDLLEGAIGVFETDEAAVATFRGQYRAFTVDEYQDVNLLQQTLLDCWLGDRDELCVVGDDYQSIYAFTGAGPEHLLGMPTSLSGGARRAPGGELPLDARGARARESPRAGARRGGEGPAPDASVRPAAGASPVSEPGRRGRRDRRGAACRSTARSTRRRSSVGRTRG